MDLKEITDLNIIKAMAFDEVSKMNLAQHNLQLLETRIAELSQAPTDTTDEQ